MDRTKINETSKKSNLKANRVNRRLDIGPTGFELYYQKSWVHKLFPGTGDSDPETRRKRLKTHVKQRNANKTERLRAEREISIQRRFHSLQQEQQETSGEEAGPRSDSQTSGGSSSSGNSEDEMGIHQRWRGITKFVMAMRVDGESRRERQTINSEESRREILDEFVGGAIRKDDRM